MGVRDRLSQLSATVRGAKTMPMSASCLVNRAEMLDAIERIRAELPANLDHAESLLSDREAVLTATREQAEHLLEEARAERRQLIEQAERILEDARGEREELIEETELLVVARARAATVTLDSRAESARLLANADEYADRKLAEFEVLLGQLASQVNNGRLRLTDRREADLARSQGTATGAVVAEPEVLDPAFG